MTAAFQLDTPTPEPQNTRMNFSGARGEFLKLLVKGSLLQIPTFGFYRFWLLTKLRRHLWSNTQIDGDAFEYTGTAKELLIGFFIALAVLVPLYIAYAIVSFMLEAQYAFASVPLVLVMYVLAHFGSYRARKYRASRTVFRGVRLWMKGSGWAYAARAMLWDFATLLTLGLALPWAMASLERYRMNHTFFGNLQGGFAGTGWSLFKRGWWVWALGLVLLAAVTMTIVVLHYTSEGEAGAAVQLIPLLIVLVGLLLLPAALAIFTRWHIDGLRFGDVTAASEFRIGTYYGLFFKLVFSSLGLLIVFSCVGLLVTYLITLLPGAGEAHWVSFVLIAVGYLTALLGLGVLQRYFFGRGVWAAIVASTTIGNLHLIDQAVAAGQPAGVLGEGLADALDFNVGI